uniref:Uncharacterized protein n=1 Tax=Arundo donax TaxID=35708 RepID=A0A0A9GXD0_ARUDO
MLSGPVGLDSSLSCQSEQKRTKAKAQGERFKTIAIASLMQLPVKVRESSLGHENFGWIVIMGTAHQGFSRQLKVTNLGFFIWKPFLAS